MEPWNAPFTWRVVALTGLTLFERGNVDGAYNLLESWSPIVFGRDTTFVSIYHQVLAVKVPLDSGKAHLAHGADPLLDFGTTPSIAPTSNDSTGSADASPTE